MTQEEFEQLQVGDRVKHPEIPEVMTIDWVEPWAGKTYSIRCYSSDGKPHRMKVTDHWDVPKLKKVE